MQNLFDSTFSGLHSSEKNSDPNVFFSNAIRILFHFKINYKSLLIEPILGKITHANCFG